MAADLRYTTADVDFLETDFQQPHADTANFEFHKRLRNPTRQQLLDALMEIGAWLASESHHPTWDGGGVQLCYAGHGQDGDGGLVLADGVLGPSEFARTLATFPMDTINKGRLRVSAVLDSCHSGAFVTALLDECITTHGDRLFPFHLAAACMEDEFAWEIPDLGHGLFTYCFSVRTDGLHSFGAEAIQADNSFGPSLAIAGHGLGCSLLSVGQQNPLLYWNATGEIEVAGRTQDVISLFGEKSDSYIGLQELRKNLREVRDRLIDDIRPMRPDMRVGDIRSDDAMRALIREHYADLGARSLHRAEEQQQL
jgi:hypothetical protein